MDICFTNARIAAFFGADTVTDGELHVRDGRIAYVGPALPDRGAFSRTIDCSGDLLLPGLKNAHSHAGMTFLRSLADDLPLEQWLYERVFPLESRLTPEDIHALTKLAILEYVSGGVTAAFDMYYYRDAIAAAAMETGFRMVLTDGVNNFGGTAQRAEVEYEKFNALHPLISYQLACHGEYTTGKPLLEDLSALVHQKKAPFFSHMNETAAEVAGCIERHGKRPFELFDELGLFDYGGGGFHCVHLSDDEMDIMARHGLYAVTCPGSNCKLGSGVAPVAELTKYGVTIAIGTDGPASNNALDLFREMYLTAVLPKLQHGAGAIDARAVLKMAVQNGATAMGLTDCDALAVGKQADIIRLNMQDPSMQPVNNILKNVVYSGSKQLVRMTMIAGKIVYEDGEFHVGTDAEAIFRAAASAAKRLTA